MSTWNYQYASKAKQVRRTFFSFHYQYDVTRAHVVRNSWVTKVDREDAGFFDASVFESKKRAGDETLKRFADASGRYAGAEYLQLYRRFGKSDLGNPWLFEPQKDDLSVGLGDYFKRFAKPF